ncbi:hypothetical protein M9Y10_009616 [Tritrichomonas musculus]|uniref:DDE-1 domain-containing protein n=1 Tax=Tritrichomonas musculus TaxID=1915356 RepID=A0ABR2IP06_9EUKA
MNGFEDGRERTVIVPVDYPHSRAPYPISRTEKNATCLAWINICELFCPPLYAVQRSTFDSEIYNYLDSESFEIVHTDSGYLNTQSIVFWIYSQFLPSLRRLRQKFNYFGPSILILNGFSAHYNAFKNVNLLQENLILHCLIPHSSDQTQLLDLCIFNSSKQFMSNYRYISLLTRQTNQIINMHTALYQSTSQLNCRSAFRSIGIDTQVRIFNNNVQILASFNLNLINKIRDYQLTPNQQYIYDCYKRVSKINTNSNTRITMPYFSKQSNKSFLVIVL